MHSTDQRPPSQDVTELTLGGRRFTILGTAHVSRASVDAVRELIAAERPDRVCVEIDAGRYNSLTDPDAWRKLDIFRVLRERKGFLLLGNLVLASFQKRLGLDLGVKPGAEMLAAIEASEELEVPYSFCDREIQTTLRRAWRNSSLWGKNKMLAALLASVFSGEKLDEAEIEALKNKNALEGMMQELSEYLPSAKTVLIDERDHYLAANIYKSVGEHVVAVIGAGHLSGVVRKLEQFAAGEASPDTEALDQVPPPKVWTRALPYVLPAVIIGLIGYGFVQGGFAGGMRSLGMWVVVNGTLSAVGAAAALAHPLTVIGSFVAAPFTSMNPTIGVGFVSAALEAWLRKPRVEDFERLQTDIAELRGFFRNRFTRILLVFLFATIGSAIGTFIAIPLLFPGSGV